MSRSPPPLNPLSRLAYAPFLTQLVVTRRCNLSCGYCNEYDKDSEPVPFDVLQRRLVKLKELGAFSVELTGGEPMLHPEIYGIIRYARQLGFYKVMMISNAYLLSEDRVRKLGRAGLQEMQISVDGVAPSEVTVKVLKPMRKKLEAVARAATFPVVLSGVLGSSPPEEVLEVIDFAKAHGFRPRVLVLHGGDGQMQLGEADKRAFEEVRRSLGRRFVEAGDYRSRLLNEGSAPFKCRAGSRYLYIDEDGIVHWCSQAREALTNTRSPSHRDSRTAPIAASTSAKALNSTPPPARSNHGRGRRGHRPRSGRSLFGRGQGRAPARACRR